MKTLKVGTHNGVFHADEVFACALITILKQLEGNEVVEITRTRDPKILNEQDLLVDVGGKYDGVKYFDHHQKDRSGLTRDTGKTYSSFGLILKHFKNQFNYEQWKSLDHFASFIDANDNGESERSLYNMSDIIGSYNLNWDDDDSLGDEMFNEALVFAVHYLCQLLDKVESKIKSKKIYNNAERYKGKVLILDQYIPYNDMIQNEEDLEYVLFRDTSTDQWKIQTIPVEKGSFVARKQLPEAWAVGNDVESINSMLNVDDTVFSHVGRFIAIWKSKSSAMKAVEFLLK